MKIKCLIILLIIAFCYQDSKANSKTDSLLQVLNNPVHDTVKVNVYVDLSRILRRTFPDSATAFAEKGLEITKKSNYKKGEANLYKNIGDINILIKPLKHLIWL